MGRGMAVAARRWLCRRLGDVGLCSTLVLAGSVQPAEWVRAGLDTNQPVWGLRGGLQLAIYPAGFRGEAGGPRGLIRLGYPVLAGGRYDLVNFLAVEPVVGGRKGFSELEFSRLDHAQGKRFWSIPAAPAIETAGVLDSGRLRTVGPGVEELAVCLGVEKFDNGAHVRVEVAQRSDVAEEIWLTIRAEPDSAPLEYCIFTATMGNLVRTRQLWLQTGTVNSRELYPHYRDTGFCPHTSFPLNRLHVTTAGDVMVAVTTDEKDPASVFPFPGSRHWYYGGMPVTQYWKKPKGAYRADLHAAVNARYTYWQSRQPIPGGVAFENFELRERFFPGQTFVFGITTNAPSHFGFTSVSKVEP